MRSSSLKLGAAICVAFFSAAWTPSSAAQPYQTFTELPQAGAQLVVDHGWAVVTSSDGSLASAHAVDLDQGTETPLMRGVTEPARGFASLENGEATVAVLIGTDSGNAFAVTASGVDVINARSPAQRITHFGVAEIGTGAETEHQVGGFAGSEFYRLNSNLGNVSTVDVEGAVPSAGLAGGIDSVIIGTTTGPLQVDITGGTGSFAINGNVIALAGNARRGVAIVYEEPGDTRLARIVRDGVPEIIRDAAPPMNPRQMATAAGGLLAWVERGAAIDTVIRVAPAGNTAATFSLPLPADMDDDSWAEVIATDGTYLVAASPVVNRLDLFDLRCYPDSGRECPMGTACSSSYNHCAATDTPDAGPSDAGPSDADANVDANTGLDANPQADSGTAGEDSGPAMLSPRAELSCTCRVAGGESSKTLPFAFTGLLLLALARRRRRS